MDHHLTTRRRTGAQTILLTLVGGLLAACGPSQPVDPLTDCPEQPLPPPAPALVLAIAVHEGAPRPALPATVLPLVSATLAAGNPVQVIAIDGTPHVLPQIAHAISDATCDAFNTTLNRSLAHLTTTLITAAADSDGNDLYAAIDLAAATVRSHADEGVAVIIDSGLADRGPLDYTTPGMTLADHDAAATYAAQTRPVDLSGVSFQLLLGWTAPPQEPLSGTERDNVTATWVATLTALGADSVIALDAPRPNEGPDTEHHTEPAPVASTGSFTPPVTETTTTVFHEQQIRFHPNNTELVDPQAARNALADVINWLAADDRHQITITGTTSSAGTEDERLQLSTARARTIQALILDELPLVPTTRVAPEGVGTHFPEFVDDRHPDGTLNEDLAAANRTVRITATIEGVTQ